MAQPLPLYAEIVKIDEDAHMVFGYASTDKRDLQGEVILKSAMENALPNYMVFANIREMHQPSAVGTAKEAVPDDKGLWLGAWIGDDRAWMKVKSKIYKGFSVGGRVTARDDNDRSVITGIELSEISLVDRPANPDAVFQIVKRADGQLRPEPLQKWDCGIPEHQHTSKSDAGTCMAHELLKRCHDDIEAELYWKRDFTQEQRDHAASSGAAMSDGSFPIQNKPDLHNAIRAVGRAKNPEKAKAHIKARARALGATDELPDSWKSDETGALEKVQPNLNSGKFGTHTAAAAEHTAQADSHAAQASSARKSEAKHRRLATKARDKGDASALAIHEHLAGASASLAEQHDNAAEQHRQLAARHSAATPVNKATMESVMTTRTVADALQDSTSAVALLASSMEINKGDTIDHAAEVKEAAALVENHNKLASEFEKAATDNRATAAKGDAKTAEPLLVKAAEADLMVVHHVGIAKGYADLIAHYAVAGNLGKALVPEVKVASAEDHTKSAAFHTELAKKATEAKDETTAKHHTAIAEAYTTLAKAASPTAEQAKPGESAAAAARGDTDGDADDGVGKDDDVAMAAKKAAEEAAKSVTEKCTKCGATMGKGTTNCSSCGAAMGKVDSPLDAGGIVAILKGALDKTTDDALKTVLSSALGSLSGGDDAAKAAEAAKKEKDAAAAKQAEIVKSIETLTADRDSAVKALDAMTNAVKGVAKDVMGLQRTVKGQIEVINTLRGQMAKYENQPEPSRAKGSLATLRKSDDVGGGEADQGDEFTKRLLEVPAGTERANWLLRQGYRGGNR